MIRQGLIAAGCAALLATGTFVHAADAPAGAAPQTLPPTLPAALAREVVDKTVELVESRGLYPLKQVEYDRAKAALLASFDGQPAQIDRKDLYARIGTLLATLDTNRHSFLIPPGRQLTVQRRPAAPADLQPATFQLIETSHGKVLRWTPPPIVNGGASAIAPYLKRFHDEAAAFPGLAQACALVVDLSEQSGGNGWPPFVAMYPLFGEANKASWVDRDGRRKPVVDRARLEGMHRNFSGGRANPFSRFASEPVAVVTARRTASAGEMLLVALLGEPRVQTFGKTTFGLSTANVTYPLADGSKLVLTETRYAVGEGPVYQGGIAPMHPAAQDEQAADAAKSAAEWVAANAPQCIGKQPKTAL